MFFSLPERIQNKIMLEPLSGCWIWTAAINGSGYGTVNVGKHGTVKGAHVYIFELITGQIIPPDKELDHHCKLRPCVNPNHLSIVTHLENMGKADTRNGNTDKTHCINGHPLAGDNLYTYTGTRGPERGCRTCRRRTAAEHYQRRKEAA